MGKKIFILVFIVSLSLNAGFAVTWLGYQFAGWSSKQNTFLCQPDAEKEIWCPLHRKLDVTKQQWKKLEPHLKRFQREVSKLAAKIQKDRNKMIDLLAAEQTDKQAIQQQQERILSDHRRMQDLVLGHIMTEKSVLDAGQQKEFFAILRNNVQCPPLMKGASGNKRGMGEFLRGLPGEDVNVSGEKDNPQSRK